MIEDERLNEIYFATAYGILMERLNESITVQFDNRNTNLTILCGVYIVVLLLMYYFLWCKFVESMRLSLWVTKSMLAIIPLEVIEKVKDIKDFLMATSKSAMSSLKD